jgi:hypothetical protein
MSTGFGIEVIAACGDRLFPVTRHGIGRERNHWDALGGRVGFDSLGSLFAADVGQCEVHQNEVGLLRSRHCNALRPIGCNNDGKAGPREPVFQHVNVIVIVLDIENLHAPLAVCRLTHLLISRVS